MPNYMDELNRQAFDSFDGFDDYDDSYDPDNDGFDDDNFNGRNKQAGNIVRKSRQQMPGAIAVPSAEFNIQIQNFTPNAIPVELFNYQNSVTKYLTENTPAGYNPVDSFRVQALRAAGGAADITMGVMGYPIVDAGVHQSNVIGFDRNGTLLYLNEAGGVYSSCQISCQEVYYRSLFDYAGRGSFKVVRMRISSQTTAQLQNPLKWYEKTFLGKSTTQTLSVQSSKSPDQFQSLIVDVKKPFKIDAEKGLIYTVNAGENVLITMSVAEYVKSAI